MEKLKKARIGLISAALAGIGCVLFATFVQNPSLAIAVRTLISAVGGALIATGGFGTFFAQHNINKLNQENNARRKSYARMDLRS